MKGRPERRSRAVRVTMEAVTRGLDAWNVRHPWSHNDHFHPWILRRLPLKRDRAVDIGCGHGALVASLSPAFQHVQGTDLDARMRGVAASRTAHLENVTINADQLADIEPGVDLVTLVAVLHHLDMEQALMQAREILAPGGRLLVVGLAAPRGFIDTCWEAASAITNPFIGLVKHPRRCPESVAQVEAPMLDPEISVGELKKVLRRVLPGARLRRHLAFRHTIEWTRPD